MAVAAGVTMVKIINGGQKSPEPDQFGTMIIKNSCRKLLYPGLNELGSQPREGQDFSNPAAMH
ncbi:MAG: hypothetical protein PWP65_1987 [Clostridia bacterium]|nr:hypothetical protein [Clostridia bacterium]